MFGGCTIVKLTPLLARPPTVTTTGPVVAPGGTVTVMLVLLHADAVAAAPLNVTRLLPCETPNPFPAMVTVLPIGADIGRTDAISTPLNVTRTVYVPVAIQFGSSEIL